MSIRRCRTQQERELSRQVRALGVAYARSLSGAAPPTSYTAARAELLPSIRDLYLHVATKRGHSAAMMIVTAPLPSTMKRAAGPAPGFDADRAAHEIERTIRAVVAA